MLEDAMGFAMTLLLQAKTVRFSQSMESSSSLRLSQGMLLHSGLNFDQAGEGFGRAELGLPPKAFDPGAL